RADAAVRPGGASGSRRLDHQPPGEAAARARPGGARRPPDGRPIRAAGADRGRAEHAPPALARATGGGRRRRRVVGARRPRTIRRAARALRPRLRRAGVTARTDSGLTHRQVMVIYGALALGMLLAA